MKYLLGQSLVNEQNEVSVFFGKFVKLSIVNIESDATTKSLGE